MDVSLTECATKNINSWPKMFFVIPIEFEWKIIVKCLTASYTGSCALSKFQPWPGKEAFNSYSMHARLLYKLEIVLPETVSQ